MAFISITPAGGQVTVSGLRDVQQLAGHSSLSTTARYIEANVEAQPKLVALVDPLTGAGLDRLTHHVHHRPQIELTYECRNRGEIDARCRTQRPPQAAA